MKLHTKSIISSVITLVFIFTVVVMLPKFTQTVWAHGDQLGEDDHHGVKKEEKKGPHGGQVLVFDENYLEFTVDHGSGDIQLFLLDKDLKLIPMSESYSGVIYITLEDGTKKTLTLEYCDEHKVSHFNTETGIKKVGPFKAVVSLKSEGGRQNFRFNWSPNIHENNE